MTSTFPARPAIRLSRHGHKRVAGGHPWVYSNEIVMDGAAKALDPGSLVTLLRDDGALIGTAMFNPHTLIAARILSRERDVAIDGAWIGARLARALALRERLFDAPYYRLVHAEADGLPGVIIDRYGDVLVLEINTAGFERLKDLLLEALIALLAPRAVAFGSNSAARRLEGLEADARVALGAIEGPVDVRENGLIYRADLIGGQKTGWFFDQRDNRKFIAALACDASVLDVYSYSGGFALACAAAGARSVTAVDRSREALALANDAAAANGLSERVSFETGEAFCVLERMKGEGALYDIVIADPPAFAKARKDIPTALKGYRKLARLAAGCVAPGGFFALASCSHHVNAESLLAEAHHALNDLGRPARLIRIGGAGADHPLHPALPESAYLKALFFALD